MTDLQTVGSQRGANGLGNERKVVGEDRLSCPPALGHRAFLPHPPPPSPIIIIIRPISNWLSTQRAFFKLEDPKLIWAGAQKGLDESS